VQVLLFPPQQSGQMSAFDANIDSNVETTKSPLTSAHCCDPFTVYEKSPQLALFKFHMEGLGEIPPELTVGLQLPFPVSLAY